MIGACGTDAAQPYEDDAATSSTGGSSGDGGTADSGIVPTTTGGSGGVSGGGDPVDSAAGNQAADATGAGGFVDAPGGDGSVETGIADTSTDAGMLDGSADDATADAFDDAADAAVVECDERFVCSGDGSSIAACQIPSSGCDEGQWHAHPGLEALSCGNFSLPPDGSGDGGAGVAGGGSDFNRPQMFVVGNVDRIHAKQMADVEVVYGGAKIIEWSLNNATLAGASGAVPAAFLASNGLFTLTATSAVTAQLDLDLNVLQAMATGSSAEQLSRQRVLEAFAHGGILTLAVSAESAPDESLFVRLRALATADFLLNASASPPLANICRYPGATGPNMIFPDVAGNLTGTPQASGSALADGLPDDTWDDYTATLSDGAGYLATGVTFAAPRGHLLWAPSDPLPPSGLSVPMVLTITHVPTGEQSAIHAYVHP